MFYGLLVSFRRFPLFERTARKEPFLNILFLKTLTLIATLLVGQGWSGPCTMTREKGEISPVCIARIQGGCFMTPG